MAEPSDLGVYGLRLRGAELGPAVQGGAPASWPMVSLAVEPGDYPAGDAAHDAERCVLPLRDGLRTLVAERKAGTARLIGPPLDAEDLAHPYLAPVATVFARWHGREAFHGAGFVAAGHAFAVLGAREAGKSTLVAALAAAGVPIVADDMLVMDAAGVCRGPRSVDLRRRPPQEVLGDAVTRVVRKGERFRMGLPDQEPQVPLGGWFFLTRGEELRIERVDAASRLSILAKWRAWRERPSDPRLMLDLGGVPSWHVQAPQRWDALPDTIAALLQRAEQAVAEAGSTVTARPS